MGQDGLDKLDWKRKPAAGAESQRMMKLATCVSAGTPGTPGTPGTTPPGHRRTGNGLSLLLTPGTPPGP
eukprot:4614523-Pyramimonas_sp.AAC.1